MHIWKGRCCSPEWNICITFVFICNVWWQGFFYVSRYNVACVSVCLFWESIYFISIRHYKKQHCRSFNWLYCRSFIIFCQTKSKILKRTLKMSLKDRCYYDYDFLVVVLLICKWSIFYSFMKKYGNLRTFPPAFKTLFWELQLDSLNDLSHRRMDVFKRNPIYCNAIYTSGLKNGSSSQVILLLTVQNDPSQPQH